MERRYIRALSGAEVRDQDLILMSDDAALADDRVLWEMLRLLPGSATPQKGIVPYAASGARVPGAGDGFTAAMHNTALVQGGTSDGSVRVMPFRAIVGSTTLFASSPIEKLRGIRSGYLVGSSSLYTTVPIAANASGNPRWSLVYVAVSPDAAGDSTTLKVKALIGGAFSDVSVLLNRITGTAIGVVDGATGSSPVRPSLPADGAGTFYVPLAYLFIPTGFGASSQVHFYEIHESAPVLTVSSALGAPVLEPANQGYAIGGVVDLAQNPNRNAANRTGAYLPSTMVGGVSRFILLQLGLSPVSHADGAVVDSSIDWRQRYFTWRVFVGAGTTSATAFVSDRNGTGAAGVSTRAPSGFASSGLGGPGVNTMTGWGQSFFNDYPSAVIATCSGVAVALGGKTAPADPSLPLVTALGNTGNDIILYVESTTGSLILKKVGSPSGQVLIWLDATAQYSNSNSF
jgi:hypothetical protein